MTEPAATTAGDASALHEALVATHHRAANACFGGLGKGMPYSAELVTEGGSTQPV